jgi:purine-nucleoside phosphorylase
MIDLNFKFKSLINFFENNSPFSPDIAVILGSGLGDFAGTLDPKKTLSTNSLPGYPPSTIPGHEGKIHFAEYAGKKLLLFQGRIHFYEGYKIYECILPVFLAHSLGCKKIIITNAAGGINPFFTPGDLMLANSFNSISIKKEITSLIGLATESGKNYFQNFPSKNLNKIIRSAALEEKIELKEGLYWYTKGPTYETPAEIKMMGKFGADAIGMSTVHEAVYAAFKGIETSAISCITNYAAGISDKRLNHEEVTETANLVKGKFERLLKKSLGLL